MIYAEYVMEIPKVEFRSTFLDQPSWFSVEFYITIKSGKSSDTLYQSGA
jgi:hypothetical protein